MENRNPGEQMAEIFGGMTDRQLEKAKACRTMEELTAYLGEQGISLPDGLLDAVAGGKYADTGEYDDDEWLWQGPSPKYHNPMSFYLRKPDEEILQVIEKCRQIQIS